MPSYEFPRSTPEAEGVPSSAILAFVDALEHHEHPLDAVHSFMLLRHGNVIAEGWWAPFRPDIPHMLYSLSKSFTSSAIGIAVEEGLLSVDDPVLRFFPDDAPSNPSENLKAMRVKHLLAMNTGHHDDTVRAVWGGTDDNWPQAFLALPVEHEPGTWFVYNTPATYMLSAIITRLTGKPLLDYLRPRLFDPLGIENPTWDIDPRGLSIGGSGLHVTTDAIARFGQMYLQGGKWNGKRLLPEAWVEQATAKHSDNSNTQTNPDWTVGYGYQFWRCRHNAYRGDGAFGQYCIVFPEHDAVLAITSGVRDLQRILDCVWEYLLPTFGDSALPADTATHTTLAGKLTSLSLPIVDGASNSAIAENVSGATYTVDPNSLGIETVTFDFDADRATVAITDSDGAHLIVAGYGDWLVDASDGRMLDSAFSRTGQIPGRERTGASSGWIAEDIFELRLCYLGNENCPVWRFHFADQAIRIEADPNVSWNEPEVTVLSGHVLL